MRVLVVIGHQNPERTSFCHAIARTAVEELNDAGHEVVYHDLYDEGFDPVLPHGEIPTSSEVPADIARHCEDVRSADGYIVVHPNWWGQPPAILKGWIDRVFRQGLVYEFGEGGAVAGLLGVKTAVVITTSNTPRDVERERFGDPLENLWKTCIFGFCGVERFTRRNFESVIMSTLDQRQGWLTEVSSIVREHFPGDE